MIRHLESSRPERVVLMTECSMSDNLALELPAIEFVRRCSLCPHMKLITLPKIAQALQALEPKDEVPAAIADRARQALQAMLGVSR
jgi:quinolinate synthase